MFQINRKGEIDKEIPYLKKLYRKASKTGAVHEAIHDLVYIKLPELERLRETETKYKELIGITTQINDLQNQLKLKFPNQ